LSADDYNAARYCLHHAVEGRTLYVFANRGTTAYTAVDREAGTFHALTGKFKLQGGEVPTDMEIRPRAFSNLTAKPRARGAGWAGESSRFIILRRSFPG